MLEEIRFVGLELRFLRSGADTSGGLDLFEMTVHPNARMPVPHYHETWDETVYGLGGTMIWRVGGQDVGLGPGETTFIGRGVVHGFRNETDKPATCLCILTPGVLGISYFREMAALLASPPPDPEKMKATMLRHGLVPAPGG